MKVILGILGIPKQMKGLSSAPRGAKMAPRWPPDGPKMTPRWPKITKHQQNNKTTKQQNNKTTEQQNEKTTKKQNKKTTKTVTQLLIEMVDFEEKFL